MIPKALSITSIHVSHLVHVYILKVLKHSVLAVLGDDWVSVELN